MVSVDAVIAANRFGLGARPGELARVGNAARDWLSDQLGRADALPAPYAGLPGSADVVIDLRARFDQMRKHARASSTPSSSNDSAAAAKALRKELDGRMRATFMAQVSARVRAAVHSETPFAERLAHFWTNYFATSADKATTRALAATLETEAIRPQLRGRFEDMLLAVEQHPAMLAYLDNLGSVGPNSDAARHARRKRNRDLGLNENLAREILELHTVGVNGGYGQADVTELSKVLTGWTVGGLHRRIPGDEPGRFFFEPRMHEPGQRHVLGKDYPDGGHSQGVDVLRDLARHPATARHVATRLVRHFIADEPPPRAVDAVAAVFTSSAGSLPEVHGALVACADAWSPEQRKVKSPEEFVVSTYRALAFSPETTRHTLAPLRLLGQTPYMPGSPAGWPDTAAQWLGPDALFKRIEWAAAVGERAGGLVDPGQLVDAILGPVATSHTRTAIARASTPAQAVTLLLASPEFQRR